MFKFICKKKKKKKRYDTVTKGLLNALRNVVNSTVNTEGSIKDFFTMESQVVFRVADREGGVWYNVIFFFFLKKLNKLSAGRIRRKSLDRALFKSIYINLNQFNGRPSASHVLLSSYNNNGLE